MHNCVHGSVPCAVSNRFRGAKMADRAMERMFPSGAWRHVLAQLRALYSRYAACCVAAGACGCATWRPSKSGACLRMIWSPRCTLPPHFYRKLGPALMVAPTLPWPTCHWNQGVIPNAVPSLSAPVCKQRRSNKMWLVSTLSHRDTPQPSNATLCVPTGL